MTLITSSRRTSTLVGRLWPVLVSRALHSTAEAGQLPANAQHPKPVALSKLKDSFLDGTSGTYLEELQERYRQNPASVDKTWASFFKSMGASFEVSNCVYLKWTNNAPQ